MIGAKLTFILSTRSTKRGQNILDSNIAVEPWTMTEDEDPLCCEGCKKAVCSVVHQTTKPTPVMIQVAN